VFVRAKCYVATSIDIYWRRLCPQKAMLKREVNIFHVQFFCHKLIRMNCWETFHMQTFHRHNILISEQQVNDINPLYELAETSRISL